MKLHTGLSDQHDRNTVLYEISKLKKRLLLHNQLLSSFPNGKIFIESLETQKEEQNDERYSKMPLDQLQSIEKNLMLLNGHLEIFARIYEKLSFNERVEVREKITDLARLLMNHF